MFMRPKVYNFGVKMPEEEFQRKAYVLGKEHSLDILRYLFSEGWSKSSDVAKELGIHIATASKYLEELHEVKILDMREAKGKTRRVKEYMIKNPEIDLNYDLREEKEKGDEVLEFFSELYDSILYRTQTLYGMVPKEVKCDTSTMKENRTIVENINKLLDYNENKIGIQPTLRLLGRAGKGIVRNYRDSLDLERLLADLPNRYRSVLEEEVK